MEASVDKNIVGAMGLVGDSPGTTGDTNKTLASVKEVMGADVLR